MITVSYQIAIADDHPMFTDGLKSILDREEDLKVVFTASNGENLLHFLRTEEGRFVDLVVMDINMPGMNGVELNRQIKNEFPHVKTLVVSMLEEAGYIRMLTEEHVNGYVSKNSEKQELLRAIRALLKGANYFSDRIREAMMKAVFETRQKPPVVLTEREKEVIRLIAKEYTTREIADQLFLSKHTIESYRKSLISKLDVRNLAGLTRYAIEHGLID